jgi:hypothetical protein
LELGQQVEQQQHRSEGSLGGVELLQAGVVGVQVVLQFGDPVLDIGAPVIVAPDLLRRPVEAGDEDPEGVARHFDQLAA